MNWPKVLQRSLPLYIGVPVNSAVLETKSFDTIGAESAPATIARQKQKDPDRPTHPRSRRLQTTTDAATSTATTSRSVLTRSRGEGAGLVLLSRLVVSVTIVLATAGAVLGVRQLTAAAPVVEAGQTLVSTPFGSVQVGSLVVLQQPDPNAMFGMPPGGMTEDAGNATVQVPVTLTNTSHETVPYSLGAFRLLAGGDRNGVSDARIDAAQELRAGSAISLQLTFSVPPAATNTLRYSPPSGSPVEVPLGPLAAQAAGGAATTPSGSGVGHAGHAAHSH
ncbi:MAG: hypothetical protein QOG60_966 [Frankiaceae bacterium]|nr:hypothetical protein [Frankiaceae bacterium]